MEAGNFNMAEWEKKENERRKRRAAMTNDEVRAALAKQANNTARLLAESRALPKTGHGPGLGGYRPTRKLRNRSKRNNKKKGKSRRAAK